ncbi:IS30 family transposase [Rhizobium sp. RHZ02]|uniref:IS30 family transposase n=1 Tax=Rhizobium sp. RHZ02 TaxID=2769306 RepID=UPI001780CB18|nr:IS30 family transposase [Rhizobium sp. RHZ02]MBD9452564.1 IS30 family transposase [Rhizobium sp. RHZ02]
MIRTFSHLSFDERRSISRMLDRKYSQSEIARRLGRDRATISREIKRNYWHDQEFPDAEGYWAMTANDMARDRRRRIGKLFRREDLRNEVIGKLESGWSPEQIAGRLKIEPAAKASVCHETIYRYVYSPEGQRQPLARLLPERRRKRRPRYARKPQNPVFPDERSIKHRPEAINDRKEFGHWEADLMIFERVQGNANVATVVERTSRFTMLFKNNDRQSKPIMERLINVLSPLPKHARQSLTFDRGFEFVSWRRLKQGMGTDAWFCDPSAPWQKGSVENMNRRIRRYLPRDTAVLSVPDESIRSLIDRLNSTPRKCLGFRTPAEVFRREVNK